MGIAPDADNWKLIVDASRMDQAALTVPPFLVATGLVYLFGSDFISPGDHGVEQVLMAAGVFIATLGWINTYRRCIKASFAKELRHVYAGLLPATILATIPAQLIGLNGLAAFAGCVGYGSAFTYARFNCQGGV